MQNTGISIPRVFLSSNEDGTVVGNMESQKINFYETEWCEVVESVSRLWRQLSPSISSAAAMWFSSRKSKMIFRLLGQNRCVQNVFQFYTYLKRFTDITSFNSVDSIDVSESFNYLFLML